MNADGSGVRQVSTDNAYYDSVNWAPDGQSLLVHSFGNGKQGVYSMDTQTGETQQLFAQQNAAPAAWSPDGTSIAYISSDFNSGGIYVVNAAGQNLKQLTTQYERAFSWSPDSKHIAFTSDRSRTVQLYSMATDGSAVEKVTDTPISQFTLSPDGSQIAYVYTPTAGSKSQIGVMNTDGSNPKELTNNQQNYYSGPVWTSDGKTIIDFVAGTSFGFGAVGADGRNWRQLLSFSGTDGSGPHPVISPDGTQIAYAAGQGGQIDIYVASVDGRSPHRLTTTGGIRPEWSPDGKYIAFIDPQQFNTAQLIKVDGTNQRALAQMSSTAETAWSPDAKYLAFVSFDALYVADVTNPTAMAQPIAPAGQNSFGPNHDIVWLSSDELLYASTHEGNYDIYYVKADGSQLTNLTQNPGDDEWIGVEVSGTTVDGNPESSAVLTGTIAGNSRVNVRSGPGTNYEVTTTAQPGTELEITGRNADSSWFAVRIDGLDGWLASFLVNVSGETSSLPVVQ